MVDTVLLESGQNVLLCVMVGYRREVETVRNPLLLTVDLIVKETVMKLENVILFHAQVRALKIMTNNNKPKFTGNKLS